MASNLTITISKKGAALALGAAVFGAGTAVLVDELFFDNYPEYSYSVAAEQPQRSTDTEFAPTTPAKPDNQPAPSAQSERVVEPTPTRITPTEAMRIAAAATEGTAIDVYPGFEAGRDVFYVDVRSGIGFKEVYVDAITGEVMKIERGL